MKKDEIRSFTIQDLGGRGKLLREVFAKRMGHAVDEVKLGFEGEGWTGRGFPEQEKVFMSPAIQFFRKAEQVLFQASSRACHIDMEYLHLDGFS
jgi:hypothetical protein